MSPLHDAVTEGTNLAFGPFPRKRTPAEVAQIHAGIEFIKPEWERDCAILMARWFGVIGSPAENIEKLCQLAEKSEYEVRAALSRVSRTLCTWERSASKWGYRYVAIEPQSAFPDGANQRDQSRERNNRRGGV